MGTALGMVGEMERAGREGRVAGEGRDGGERVRVFEGSAERLSHEAPTEYLRVK
jgi:hypothetical protein